jgi:hypothetical protein
MTAWIHEVLRKDGRATLVRGDVYTSATISAYDYSHLLELALTQYTLVDDDNHQDELQEAVKSTAQQPEDRGDRTHHKKHA